MKVCVCVFESAIVLDAVLSGGVGEDGVRNGSLALTSVTRDAAKQLCTRISTCGVNVHGVKVVGRNN